MISLTLAGLLAAAFPAPAAERRQLTLLYLGGLEGRFTSTDCERPPSADLANLAAVVESVRQRLREQQRDPPLLINAGDTIGPGAFGRWLLAESPDGAARLVAWLRRVGFDFTGLGDADLDAVPARLQSFMEQARRQGLALGAANLDCRQAGTGYCHRLPPPLGERLVWLERAGLRLAVLGLVSAGPRTAAGAERPAAARAADPFKRARLLARQARAAGADLVLAVAHLDGRHGAPRQAVELARRVPDLDLVIGPGLPGPAAQLRQVELEPGTAPVIGVDYRGRFLGRAEIELRRDAERWRLAALHTSIVDLTAAPAAGALRQELRAAAGEYCRQWRRPLGDFTLQQPLAAEQFLQLALRLVRLGTGAELAFLSRELVADGQVFPLNGTITRHDIFAALPRRTGLRVGRLNAAELRALCLRLTAESQLQAPARLAYLGLECGEQVKVNGRALTDQDSYGAVLDQWLAAGAWGYFTEAGKRFAAFRDEQGRQPVLGQLLRRQLSGKRFGRDRPPDRPDSFPDLSRHLRWRFTGDVDLQLADTRIDNSAGYQQSQLTREQLLALKGGLRGRISADSSLHTFALGSELRYARSAVGGQDFLESDDLLAANLLYRLNALRLGRSAWYLPAPYFEGNLESEFSRPAERDYHHLELTATLGVRFSLLPTLEAKLGVGVRDEVFDPALPFYVLEVGAELQRTDLVTILGSPLQWEARFSLYLGDVGRANTAKGQLSNRLYFALVGPLFFTINHDLFFYRESRQGYALASDLTFGLSTHLDYAVQSF